MDGLELDEIEAIEGNRFLVALNEIDGDVLTATSPEREKRRNLGSTVNMNKNEILLTLFPNERKSTEGWLFETFVTVRL